MSYKETENRNFMKNCDNYEYIQTIFPARSRIIAIGDIHGDYKVAIKSLKLAKVIDDNMNWIGNDTVVVQVGDQIDRCRPFQKKCIEPEATSGDEASDIKILKLFNELHKKAIKHGGAVISLLGNHELMNVMGNMNYVSYKGLEEFKNYKDPKHPDMRFSSDENARAYAFKPGNEYAKLLGCSRLTSVVIGSFIFVHGGIVPEFMVKNDVRSGDDLYRINNNVRQWLLGQISVSNVSQIVNSFGYSMFWNRILGNIPKNEHPDYETCKKYLDPVLDTFKLKGMIIGHTPQYINNNAGINNTCGDKLWRTDIGMSKAFNIFGDEMKELRDVQVLEILNDKEFNVLK